MSVFDTYADKPIWKGQNHRTQQVGFFPRICLSITTTNTNEKVSWPVRGSFIHTGHRDGTGQGPSWGKIDQIDEYLSLIFIFHEYLKFFLELFSAIQLLHQLILMKEMIMYRVSFDFLFMIRIDNYFSCLEYSSNEWIT